MRTTKTRSFGLIGLKNNNGNNNRGIYRRDHKTKKLNVCFSYVGKILKRKLISNHKNVKGKRWNIKENELWYVRGSAHQKLSLLLSTAFANHWMTWRPLSLSLSLSLSQFCCFLLAVNFFLFLWWYPSRCFKYQPHKWQNLLFKPI